MKELFRKETPTSSNQVVLSPGLGGTGRDSTDRCQALDLLFWFYTVSLCVNNESLCRS